MSHETQPSILIADDQRDVLEALRLLLKGESFRVVTVGSPLEALEAFAKSTFDVLLLDLNYTRDTTSGKEGLDLIRKLRALDPDVGMVVMTAWGTIELAVEAMRLGASDFVEKPWDNNRLLSILRNQIALQGARRKSRKLEAENQLLRDEGKEAFIAESAVMKPIMDLVARVAPSDANVLITGEPGTGKGLVARMIHELSPRKDKSLVSVNMGGLAESVFESEMFGHVKGAFTDARSDRVGRFELADGGSLFLDEIANIPVSHQAKLLRVLEEGEFERVGSSRTSRAQVRVISATNSDLHRAIDDGEFRKDLFYRLNTVEIHLPPLRERAEDLLEIARHYLERYAAKYDRQLRGFSSDAVKQLQAYSWPGNIRELNHVIERAILMTNDDEIQAGDLRLGGNNQANADLDNLTLEAAEKLLIRNTLDRLDGNVNQAADALGLSRSALYRRIEKYGL